MSKASGSPPSVSTDRHILFFGEHYISNDTENTRDQPDYDGFFPLLRRLGFHAEHVVPFRFPWNPFANRHPLWRGLDPVRAFWALLCRRRAAAIISYGESGALMSCLLRVVSRNKVIVLHDVDHSNWKTRKIIQDAVFRRVDAVMVATKIQEKYLRDQYNVQCPIFYLGPRIDDVFFQSSQPQSNDYVIAVGNDRARDFSFLLSAIEPLDVNLLLLTRLPVEIPDHIKHKVRIIDRRVTYAELRDLYNNALLVALPLLERQSPGGMTSVLEAMAMGKPVVMTASSGVLEFVDHEETGLVVPLGDVVAFREAIRRLWNDRAGAAEMGARGRARFDQRYSTQRFAERLAASLRACGV